jgi:AcrR family transcriptional regulator
MNTRGFRQGRSRVADDPAVLAPLAPKVYTVYMDTADRILAAARTRFQQGGMDGLSLREIAADVGITPMAIYRHYENKQALIDALTLDALDEWSNIVAGIPPAEPLTWLRAISEAHLEFALDRPRRYEAAFLLHSTKARRYPDDFVDGKSPAGALQLRLIRRLMEEGVIRADSAIEVMVTNSALSQGLVTLYRAGRIAGGEAEFRAIYRRAMERNIQSFMVDQEA